MVDLYTTSYANMMEKNKTANKSLEIKQDTLEFVSFILVTVVYGICKIEQLVYYCTS